uniref:Ferroxidase n=1 Tax=Panagrolaimus sp. PS1159 TaxID=55785 RepID=A0AC35F0X6_9BILA
MLASLRPMCSHWNLIIKRTSCQITTFNQNDYERIAEYTLEHLYDYLDQLPDQVNVEPEYDVSYAMGVLTAKISNKVGTYVINKQSPNRQIWLSSPFSGPKRYDFIDKKWIYSHDGLSMHYLLQNEFEKIFENDKIRIFELEKHLAKHV